jgi:gamma-glutamyltranspeptidase/glutathione hydrolase
MEYPPEFGPLAAVTPGTPGGLLTMLAEYGRLSLEEVLEPAIHMADGYPIEASTANSIERSKDLIKEWPYSRAVLLPHLGQTEREAPYPGEIFVQRDLAATLRKLVDAEEKALAQGKSRKEAIYAAYDRFYRGDIAEEFARGSQEQGGLHTKEDLARWKVYVEEPVSTTYKGIEVYKLTHWVQSPVLLQTLNLLEPIDVKSMGYNSSRYIHTLYQAMNLAFADRDFYYGDPSVPPEEPVAGLLSKDYAASRARLIDAERNDPDVGPGDPYPFMQGSNPYLELLRGPGPRPPSDGPGAEEPAGVDGRGAPGDVSLGSGGDAAAEESRAADSFFAGTTSIQAADAEGWVVSITPSGGWIPAVVAGETGIGLSQRMQSFVLDEAENPFNVVAPGKRPRVTLTPTLALKDGSPFLSFAVQGGDSQDQNLLQFFLNVVEFGMDVQQAAEAANVGSFQVRSSFGEHESEPGRLMIRDDVPSWVQMELRAMGYDLLPRPRTSGPINAIFFDREHGTFWGGSSNHGDDYGIAW